MQKNLGFETEIAQWAHTRQFFLWISTHFYSIFQVFCVYWLSGRIHAVGVITRLYGKAVKLIFGFRHRIFVYPPDPPIDKIFRKSPLGSVDLAYVWSVNFRYELFNVISNILIVV